MICKKIILGKIKNAIYEFKSSKDFIHYIKNLNVIIEDDFYFCVQ